MRHLPLPPERREPAPGSIRKDQLTKKTDSDRIGWSEGCGRVLADRLRGAFDRVGRESGEASTFITWRNRDRMSGHGRRYPRFGFPQTAQFGGTSDGFPQGRDP